MIEAEFQFIEPVYTPLHAINEKTVAAIVDTKTDVDGTCLPWSEPPVLVVEPMDETDAYGVLDGHHRLAAASQLGLNFIPAYVVSAEDHERLLDEKFGGLLPSCMDDFCKHIMCDGRPGNSLTE